MKQIEEVYDVVVCGGGMSGFCAAVAAARHGAKTCLVQDRPVLGGNASSEIRVTVHGSACHHAFARETGILGEVLRAERGANHLTPNENGWINSVQDMALYDIALNEPNLALRLNTRLSDVLLSDGRWSIDRLGEWPAAHAEKGYYERPACQQGLSVEAVRCVVANAETELRLRAPLFIDCTGDALLAHLAGCEWRMGSESRVDTGEIHAAFEASADTMGNSIHIRCVDTGRPSPFTPPAWAVKQRDPDYFYKQGRVPNDPQGGYWWIEIGVPWHTIHDNETIRHELTRHALGVWDWMKNHDPVMKERCKHFALDWIGQVPGKRESRRVMGLHLLNENELQAREVFPDECAYGGWFIDLHTPGGLLAATSEPASAVGYNDQLKDIALKYIGPYGIPLRSLLCKDVPNLALAGRNLSVTHAALGTVRVMGTCGLMGQAVGTLAALAGGRSFHDAWRDRVAPLQQTLLRDGCFLPNHRNRDPADLARAATASADSSFRVAGCGAQEAAEDQNLREWTHRWARGREIPAGEFPCQWLFLDGSPLARVGVDLRNADGQTRRCTVRLRKVASIWDYDPNGQGGPIWESELELPAGHEGLCWMDAAVSVPAAGCHRLEISGDEGVFCRLSARQIAGFCAGRKIGSGKYNWLRMAGNLAFHLDPPQAVFGPEQVLSGVTRPHTQTNHWLGDPSRPLPQAFELRWPAPVGISTVELTFPTQWLMEPHWENPFYVPPHIARAYRVQVWEKGAWRDLVRETDNRKERRRHALETPVRCDRLRLLVEETHGARSAGLAEIRALAWCP
jgi:hypothetical protein